jgi:hypothetical protein
MSLNAQNNLPPVKLAFVIDGKIVETFYTDHRFGAILLSDPIVVDITEMSNTLSYGYDYHSETGTFTPPDKGH